MKISSALILISLVSFIESGFSQDCFSSLQPLIDAVAEKDRFVIETYVLCPNTTFELGFGETAQSLPLVTNTIYQCGEDGNPMNNCIIDGGGVAQFAPVQPDPLDAEIFMMVKGLTLQRSGEFVFGIQGPGEVTFEDCVFRDHNPALIGFLAYNPTGDGRRLGDDLLSSFGKPDMISYDQEDDRMLQQNNTNSSLSVVMDGCLFTEIVQRDANGANGMIQAGTPFNDLTFRGCLFTNITYPGLVTDPIVS